MKVAVLYSTVMCGYCHIHWDFIGSQNCYVYKLGCSNICTFQPSILSRNLIAIILICLHPKL